MACRCSRPILKWAACCTLCITHAAFAEHIYGTHRGNNSARAYSESRIVSDEPRRLPLAIFLMNRGTSMCVGHATMAGSIEAKTSIDSLRTSAADLQTADGSPRKTSEGHLAEAHHRTALCKTLVQIALVNSSTSVPRDIHRRRQTDHVAV